MHDFTQFLRTTPTKYSELSKFAQGYLKAAVVDGQENGVSKLGRVDNLEDDATYDPELITHIHHHTEKFLNSILPETGKSVRESYPQYYYFGPSSPIHEEQGGWSFFQSSAGKKYDSFNTIDLWKPLKGTSHPLHNHSKKFGHVVLCRTTDNKIGLFMHS